MILIYMMLIYYTWVFFSLGIKYLYSWPDGVKVTKLTELKADKEYVCCNKAKLDTSKEYGNSREKQFNYSKAPVAESHLFTKKNGEVKNYFFTRFLSFSQYCHCYESLISKFYAKTLKFYSWAMKVNSTQDAKNCDFPKCAG